MSNVEVKSSKTPEKGRITTEVKGRVLLIGIDRPRKFNAFTKKMLLGLAEALTEYEKNPDLWCAVLFAEGKNFTAGLQLDEFNITDDLCPEGLVDPFSLREPVRKKPLVTAVQGVCFTAGVELMLASDVVIAADDCRFAQMEVKRGLMAFGGATIRMVASAGFGNAMRYLLTGDEFNAEEAYRLGFVQDVVPRGEQKERAILFAERIAAQAPIAVQAMRESSWIFSQQGQDEAVAAFPDQLKKIFASEDFMEGVRSFLERREGKFNGR
ncbi:MAG: crotonase/enoyl-CoA hydratase family protein [Deltaproteobacteria bacterium]|nr:crotonase/enoyl-CoA hydratase family protein [Deltaproteobacteria bacterium]